MKLSKFNSHALYVLRIIAAQAVLFGHLFTFFKISPFAEQKYFPHIQSLAVIAFFLLSGFLTDYSAQNKPKDYSFTDYMKAHTFRIYSFFLAALAFIAIVDGCIIVLGEYLHNDNYNGLSFISNLLMLPLIFQPFGSGRPIWTLFIEWWLYVAYGYFFFKCKKDDENGTLQCIKIIVGVALFTIPLGGYIWQGGQYAMTIYAFVMGIICNRIYIRLSASKIRLSLTCTFILFAGSCLYFKDAYHFLTVIFMGLLFLQFLVLGRDKSSHIGERGEKRLIFLSGVTYPLYLIHYTVIEFFLFTPFISSEILQFILSVALSNLIAIALYLAFRPRKKIN